MAGLDEEKHEPDKKTTTARPSARCSSSGGKNYLPREAKKEAEFTTGLCVFRSALI